MAYPHLVRLITILHTALEHNIDFAAALAFKRMLADHVRQPGPLLESRLSFLGTGEAAQLLLRLHALISFTRAGGASKRRRLNGKFGFTGQDSLGHGRF